MIAYPPQKPPSIREQFAVWKAHTASTPDLMLEHLRGSGLICPRCGMEMTVRRGRRSGRYMVFHPACDDMGGFEWWGDTREEAIAEFQRFSAISPQEQSGSPSLVKNQGSELRLLGNTPHKKESTDSATPGPKAGASNGASSLELGKSSANGSRLREVAKIVWRERPPPPMAINTRNDLIEKALHGFMHLDFFEKTTFFFQNQGNRFGPATFQGMEFSVEGLSEEAVNSLLTMKEEG